MGSKNANIQASISLTYDKTKTSLFGRMRQKTEASIQVISPSLTRFADVYTFSGNTFAPGHCIVNPNTGRKFELQNSTTNTPTVLAFTFDLATGLWVYVGKVILNLPTGVHTFRSFAVDDSNSSNIKLVVNSAVTTATCNSGAYKTWLLTLADFTVGGTTIYMATQTNQKAVYFDQYTGQAGQTHTGTNPGGVGCGAVLATPTTKMYMLNGTAALMNIFEWDFSLGNPAVEGTNVNGVASSTTAYASTSPAAYFRLGASQLGYSTVANTTAAFEAIILQNGTTNVPTNFTQTPNNAVQTQYFMRDLQLVGGVWYFNLAATSTGAAVVPATASATFSIMRANGISTSHAVKKTGFITPALSGTIVQAHSFGVARPKNIPANAALNNTDCLFITTSTNFYMGKISDIADGSTSWTSLTPVNILGNGLDVVAPTVTLARYDDYIDRWVYLNGTHQFLVKPHANSILTTVFGRLTNYFLETKNNPLDPPVLATTLSISMAGGWLFIVGNTNGQRGVIGIDVYSDQIFNNSYFITKVLQVDPGSILSSIDTTEAYGKLTEESIVYIRSAPAASDTLFDSESGGWVEIDVYNIGSSTSIGPFFQLKFKSSVMGDLSNSPAQINDVEVSYENLQENSNDWSGSVDNTSRDGETPTKTAFRMIKSTSGEKVFRAYDDAGNLYHSASTATDYAFFSKTTNNGLTVSAMTSANDYSSTPLTTEIIYNWLTPPGIRVTCSLRDA